MYSIGLDISKSNIAVYIPKGKLDIEIENSIKSLKSLYVKLKENGKHTTVAQIAVMGKLVIIAHSLFKRGELYDENRYLSY